MNISGNTTLNNSTTCISSLNISGITRLSGNVGIGTISSGSILQVGNARRLKLEVEQRILH